MLYLSLFLFIVVFTIVCIYTCHFNGHLFIYYYYIIVICIIFHCVKKEVNYVKKLQLYLLLLFYIIFVPLHKNVYIAMHYYFKTF